ncbi:MAG: hypothetical protein K2Y51_24460 [Gammaproteobacteria bacterium]|nr:hypothetical protein [Gammaproteobacteria bacterium]
MGSLASRHRRHFDAVSLRPTPGITYAVDADYRMIWECWRGNVTLDELESFWTALSRDEEACAHRRTLADIRFCDPQFSSEQWIHLLDLFHLPDTPFQGWRCAIVTTEARVQQLAGQFLAYGAETVEAEIFDCAAAALLWLLRGQREEMADTRAAHHHRAHG